MSEHCDGSSTSMTRSKIEYLSYCNDETKQSVYSILDEIDKFDYKSNIYKYTVDDADDIPENKISLYWYEKGVFLNIGSKDYTIIKIVEANVYKKVYTISDSAKVVQIINSIKSR